MGFGFAKLQKYGKLPYLIGKKRQKRFLQYLRPTFFQKNEKNACA